MPLLLNPQLCHQCAFFLFPWLSFVLQFSFLLSFLPPASNPLLLSLFLSIYSIHMGLRVHKTTKGRSQYQAPFSITLHLIVLSRGLLLNLEFVNLARMADQWPSGIDLSLCILALQTLRLQMCTLKTGLYTRAGVLNSGSHAYTADTLLAKLAVQPLSFCFFNKLQLYFKLSYPVFLFCVQVKDLIFT